MPQQPQSPQPDQPEPPMQTPDSTGGHQQQGAPPQPTRGTTPPGGAPTAPAYVPANGYGPVPAPGRAPVAGGSGAVAAQPGRPGAYPPPVGPLQSPPPGYGPAVAPPAYRPLPPASPIQGVAASGAGATSAVDASAELLSAEAKKKDLTVNKLLAGAGAAATSAVLGSFFGALGTVGGAAIGSVFSAVITSFYQRSLDKTRDTVKAKVKLSGGKTLKISGATEVPAPRGAEDQASTRVFVTPGDQPTEVISAVPAVDVGPPNSRRRLLMMTGFTVVVFALGMLAITGIELVKGSPLNTSSTSTSERPGGTSLGSVLGGSGSAGTDASTDTATRSATQEPTRGSTTSEQPTDEGGGAAVPGRGFSVDEDEPTPTRSTRATPTPTPTPQSGADDQSGQGSQSDGGGAAPQPVGGAGAPDAQQ